MVNTSNSPDANSIVGKKIKQDMATYSDDVDVSINRTQLDKDVLPWEVKPSSAAEPFSDPPENASPDELENHEFETDTDAGMLTRGQIATYLTEISARQHRTHAFLVFMTDTNVFSQSGPDRNPGLSIIQLSHKLSASCGIPLAILPCLGYYSWVRSYCSTGER
jgi:hypothetical protein